MAKGKKTIEPEYLPSPLNTPMLNYAHYHLSAGEKMLYAALIFIAGGIIGLVFYGGLFKSDGEATLATYISNVVVFALIGGIAIKLFLPAISGSLKNRRDRALRKQFQSFLDSLVTSLSSGGTLNDAVQNARNDLSGQYTDKDYIMREVDEILLGMANGQTLEIMLASFGERSGNEDIQNFSNIIGNCYRMGGDFKSVVRKTRDIISDKMEIAEEVATKVSSNKIQHTAMSLMPIVIMLMLKMMSSSFAANLSSLAGVLLTTVSVGIFVGSYFWGRKIIDIG